MGKRLDLVGQRFGRLTVISDVGNRHHESLWECICDCGNTTLVICNNLRRGTTKSCGCYMKERTRDVSTTHGQSRVGLTTLVYMCWGSMMKRCYNSKHRDFKYYGGRGIKVCERWHKFENFFEDMGNPPEGMTLDRIDNDGDYTPENCRWATWEEQQNNRGNNHWVEFKGERKTVTQWERSLGMNKNTLWRRLYRGWSIEQALTTPVGGNK
jgi:hypothetical protein